MSARAVRVHHALLGAWLVAVAAVTLTPTTGPARQLSVCLACGVFGLSELLLNVLLFMPLGVLVARFRKVTTHARGASRPLRDALLLGAFLSLAIEMVQWLAGIGRVSALGDLLANASGALIGSALYCHRLLLWAPHGTWRRRLIAGWLVVIGLNLAFGYWSSRPWLPEGRWYLQRTPVRAHTDAYSGTLLFAGLGNRSLPSDIIQDSTLLRGFRSGSVDALVRERPGAATKRPSYVIRFVQSPDGYEVFSLSRSGDNATLRRLTNAARSHVTYVGLRLPNWYAGLEQHDILWTINAVTGRIVLTSDSLSRVTALGPATPLRGWTIFLWRQLDLSPRLLMLFDVIWLFVLLLPLLRWTVNPTQRNTQRDEVASEPRRAT